MSNRPILFLKSHVKDYTRKDGTVVHAHEDKRAAKVVRTPAHNHAEAAAAIAGRARESVHREHCEGCSQAALGATRAARSKRDHMNAALVHDDAGQNHRTAAHVLRQNVATAGVAQEHGAAAQSHEWAAAAHREEASKPK